MGASYTTESKITFNLEYHYSETAFSPQDWRNWFRAGAANSGCAPRHAALWYIRAYALDQQEPISRHSAFLRADWPDAFVPHLELTALLSTDLHDGSSAAQVSADYDLSDQWSVGGSSPPRSAPSGPISAACRRPRACCSSSSAISDGDSIMLGIVTHTPPWVWALFALLVGLGVQSLKPRAVPAGGSSSCPCSSSPGAC